MNTEYDSTILLLCLKPDKAGKRQEDITTLDLCQQFLKYGQLKKILIFSRKFNLKAFLEYSSKEEAKKAINTLNKKINLNLGHIKLFFSSQSQITPNSSQQDYWCEKGNFDQTSDNINQKDKTKEHLQKEKIFTRKVDNSCSETVVSEVKTVKRPYQTHKRSLFSLKSLELRKGSEFKVKTKQTEQPKNLMSPSKVVLISNTADVFETVQQVYNLFSNFGSIKTIILMKNLQKVLIEYYYRESAKQAIINVSGTEINNTTLKVNYSKYEHIDVDRSRRTSNSSLYNEIMVLEEKDLSYTQGIGQSVSNTLLFTFKQENRISITDVCAFTERLGEPAYISYNETDKDKAFRVEFKNKAIAMKIMSKYQGVVVKGCKANLRFN